MKRKPAHDSPPAAPAEPGLIVQAALAQIPDTPPAFVQRAVAQLPWRHHTILLDKLSTADDRHWYAARTVEHGWSGDTLALQIRYALRNEWELSAGANPEPLMPLAIDAACRIEWKPGMFHAGLSWNHDREVASITEPDIRACCEITTEEGRQP